MSDDDLRDFFDRIMKLNPDSYADLIQLRSQIRRDQERFDHLVELLKYATEPDFRRGFVASAYKRDPEFRKIIGDFFRSFNETLLEIKETDPQAYEELFGDTKPTLMGIIKVAK